MFKINFAFFGTDSFASTVLEELKRSGLIPSVIISAPNKPQGKKQLIVPSPVKMWAEKHNIPILQPTKLDSEFALELKAKSLQLFIVASYGKIIPQNILDIPKYKTLNIHPSLLPKLRGSSPLEYAILQEKKTGVTIIRLDNEMDHGPIITQEESPIVLPTGRKELERNLAIQGAKMLIDVIPKWIDGSVKEIKQNHAKSTYTEKIKKIDGLIDLENPIESYKKILAFEGWPGAFFLTERNSKKIRVLVLEAKLNHENKLNIIKVKPEGKKEMSYEDFLRGRKSN